MDNVISSNYIIEILLEVALFIYCLLLFYRVLLYLLNMTKHSTVFHIYLLFPIGFLRYN
jgi:hypothetical protein